jgi:D-alanine-D-alanine ligase
MQQTTHNFPHENNYSSVIILIIMHKIRRPLSVAILYYAGTHQDDEDTIDGVKGIEESLKRTGHPVTKIIVTKQNWQQALQTPGDIVFNFVEDDTWELYEKVAYGLERLGRAQVGHDTAGLKYAIRKLPIKRLMEKMRISTPNFKMYTANTKRIEPGNLRFPVIIKPSNQHAGIGISQQSVVSNETDFKKQVTHIIRTYPGEVIAEEFVQGREIHVSILGNGDRLIVFPFCEIGFKGKFASHWSVYTYDAKWAKKTWEYADARVDAPAKITRKLATRIKTLSVRAYRAFKCRDIARIDVRVDEKETPFLVDVNMNPSINYYDDQDATLASVYALGWTYDQFIERLLAITYARLRK